MNTTEKKRAEKFVHEAMTNAAAKAIALVDEMKSDDVPVALREEADGLAESVANVYQWAAAEGYDVQFKKEGAVFVPTYKKREEFRNAGRDEGAAVAKKGRELIGKIWGEELTMTQVMEAIGNLLDTD